MQEHFEGESSNLNKEWTDAFLQEVKKELEKELGKDAKLFEFRGFMDKHNIQEHEAHNFLEAYKKGYESTKQFLEEREKAQKEPQYVVPLPKEKEVEEPQHVVPLPEEKEVEKHPHHKTAA